MKINYKKFSTRQHYEIYDSTKKFISFVQSKLNLNKKKIIDLGCGGAANTIYLAKKFKNSFFLGIDYNTQLINIGKKFLKKNKNLKNLELKKDKWQNILRYKSKYDGILSFHTLSYLDIWYTESLKNIKKKNFNFVALSSLFYEGKVDYKIFVNDFSKSEFTKSYYNIFSVTKIKKILKKNGYRKIFYKEFMIERNLKKPAHKGMGAYTLKLINKKKIVFSGGMYIPCGFILAY